MSDVATGYKSITIKCGCPEPIRVEEKFGISMLGDVCPKCGVRLSLGEGAKPPEPAPAPAPAPEATAPVPTAEERSGGMLCHLASFAGFLGIPFGSILGPMLVWMTKKDKSPFVDDQGKEALNFQISIHIYLIISLVLIFVLIGLVLLPAVALFDVILTIIAAVKANNGERYRYPLTIRFIK